MLQALLLDGEHRSSISWPRERSRWADGGGVLWLDMQGAADEAIHQLGEAFGLHPAVVQACIQPEHRARLKEFRDHILLVLNAVGQPGAENGHSVSIRNWRTLELNVVIGPRYLLTVHPAPIPALTDLYQRVSQEGEGRPTLEYLVYALSDAVTAGYYPVLDRIDRYVDDAENAIFKGPPNRRVVDRLFQLKRQILYLRRTLAPQRDALGALMRRDFEVLSDEARPYMMDVYEHSLRLFDLLDTYRDLISSSLDAHLSMVSNRMNEIMKMLTIVSTVMLPLTLVTGIFGMNFAVMPLVAAPWGFWAVILGMLMLGGAMTYFFHRRGWL